MLRDRIEKDEGDELDDENDGYPNIKSAGGYTIKSGC
jgi:hypothetical protein